MEQIENRMVNELVRKKILNGYPSEVLEKLNGPGYREIGTDNFVQEENAFDYALDQCVNFVPTGLHGVDWTQEFKDMLVGWFYSDDRWVMEE